MDIGSIITAGIFATVVLTLIMAISKPLGWSRMDIPFLVGTFFTANRNRAPLYGLLAHMVIGTGFAFGYHELFHTFRTTAWWFGLLAGAVHAAFVLSAGLIVLSSVHPRMAHPYQGPTPTRQLQPPGFFALNYGKSTPAITTIAHLVYGLILGIWYH